MRRAVLPACLLPWPFDTIMPENWAALTDDDKAMIEALTATFIAELTLGPALDDRPYPARR